MVRMNYDLRLAHRPRSFKILPFLGEPGEALALWGSVNCSPLHSLPQLRLVRLTTAVQPLLLRIFFLVQLAFTTVARCLTLSCCRHSANSEDLTCLS